MDNGTFAFLVRETGWSLEYIRAQPVFLLSALCAELFYQRAVEDYREDCRIASLMATMARFWGNKRVSVEDIIGMPPERRTMTEEGILAKGTPPQKITLADGKEYELSPMTLNMLVAMEEEFNLSLSELLGSGKVKPIRSMLYLQLRGKYPELTIEKVGELVTMEVLSQIGSVIGV